MRTNSYNLDYINLDSLDIEKLKKIESEVSREVNSVENSISLRNKEINRLNYEIGVGEKVVAENESFVKNAISFLQDFVWNKERKIVNLNKKIKKSIKAPVAQKINDFEQQAKTASKDRDNALIQSAEKERLKSQITAFSTELEQEFLKSRNLGNNTKE
ncbi:MAG: hypothetical protein GKR88_11325 [Flavobacteriaceae bacterium]|nr:MAG: hypothetical protein GKR88_11325 [Flavobacteriaceae bacterium]